VFFKPFAQRQSVTSVKKLLLMFLALAGPSQNLEGKSGAFLLLSLLAQLVIFTKIICL
jgi:hypothetical protein